ncbi:MAG: redoxin domain-containing protein [Haloarculaceae archaeon]
MQPEGETAPDFELRGVDRGTVDTYRLSDPLAEGRAVLLFFYPFDFSPVCTAQLCAIRDAEWFEFTSGLAVWGLSADSVYAHRAFAEEYALDFPLLSDYDGSVAADYGVRHDRLQGHQGVSKRSVALVDSSRTVRYAWESDAHDEKPDFAAIKRAVDRLDEVDSPPSRDFDVRFDDGPPVP